MGRRRGSRCWPRSRPARFAGRARRAGARRAGGASGRWVIQRKVSAGAAFQVSRQRIQCKDRRILITGCTVTGDLGALFEGNPTELRLQTRLTISDDHRYVLVDNIPPDVSVDDVAISISPRAQHRHWAREYPGLRQATGLQLNNMRVALDQHHDDRIVCTPLTGTPPEALRGLAAPLRRAPDSSSALDPVCGQLRSRNCTLTS
jgi:hypothetical protein